MRETVERATGAPCVFALGACGDIGPRYGFVGDLRAADQNGEQLGYAALAALAALRPPGHRPALRRAGGSPGPPSGSGRTPPSPPSARPGPRRSRAASTRWICPSTAARSGRAAGGARRMGGPAGAVDAGARRTSPATTGPGRSGPGAGWPAWRTSRRAPPTPCPSACTASATPSGWPAAAEPFSALQVELRRRFRTRGGSSSPPWRAPSRWPTCSPPCYGLGLYQEEPSILAPGCLEALTGAVAARIAALRDAPPRRPALTARRRPPGPVCGPSPPAPRRRRNAGRCRARIPLTVVDPGATLWP